MGRAREELAQVAPRGEPIVPDSMGDASSRLERMLLMPPSTVDGEPRLREAIPDGNRGAVVPDLLVEHAGREWVVGVKGIGARHPMFGQGHLAAAGTPRPGDRQFTSEAWFGENPWGSMSEQACREDAAVTDLADGEAIEGFHVCPMLRAEPLPKDIMERARSTWWYRRLDRPGVHYQQLRLLPSDVRLFYASEFTLGTRLPQVLEAFGVDDLPDLDAFIDRYLSSGLAALTLIARTVEPHDAWGHRALDYDDVWLDKDSLLAPDGTLHFADIEGLAWVPLRDADEARHRTVRQFNRNLYELLYGLDCLLDERDRRADHRVTRPARRRELALRLDMALEGDPRVATEERGSALHLVITPRAAELPAVTIKIIDMDG